MARAKTSPRSMHPNDAGKLFDGEAFGCCFFLGFLPEVSGFDNTTATLTGSRETVRPTCVAPLTVSALRTAAWVLRLEPLIRIRDIEPALSRSTQLLALASCSVIILRRSAPRGMLPQPAKTIADKTQADKAAFLILSPFVTLNFENLPTR